MRQRIESLEQFRALQADYMAARDAEKRKILVCCGTGCVAGGNLNVYHELKKRMDELGIPCEVSLTEHHADAIGLKKSGCHGFCEMGPLVRIEPEGWLYTKCQVSDVEEIIQKTILGGERSEEHTSELQSRFDLVCRLLLEKKKKKKTIKQKKIV